MVNAAARRLARQVDAGADVPLETDPKVRTFGDWAHVLRALTPERLAADLQTFSGTSIDHLEAAIGVSMGEVAFTALSQSDRRSRLNVGQNTLRVRAGQDSSPVAALNTADSGVRVGKFAFGTALRTVRYRVMRGEPITRGGLHASGIVPFLIALQFGGQAPDGSSHYNLFEYPEELWAEDERGPVFTDRAVRMDRQGGLALTADPVYYEQAVTEGKDMHIGCPMTLIQDRIQALFRVMSDVAVARGIIQTSD